MTAALHTSVTRRLICALFFLTWTGCYTDSSSQSGALDLNTQEKVHKPGQSGPAQASAVCPDLSLGESAYDCPWAKIARDLRDVATRGQNIGVLFDAKASALAADMQKDAQYPSWLNLWGAAINFDEGAHGIIVDPPLVDLLNQRLGVARRFEATTAPDASHSITHAGVQHTYGYLFSTLKTRFGFKRARWVNAEVSEGFGLPPGLLGPAPQSGSLFMNATYFAGSIAFANDLIERATLTAVATLHPQVVASALRNYDFKQLNIQRLSETIQLPGTKRTVILRTDFVKWPHPNPRSPNIAWLIYSVYDSADRRSRLISAFPVDQSTISRLTDPSRLGNDQMITTVFNAYVTGVTGAKLKGSRTIR